MGYWKNDRQDGIGIEKWQEGVEYVGEFSMGKKQGIGKYVFPNGYIYYGEWEQNLMNGYGLYLFDQNKIYIGEWLNGLKDGYGEIYGENHNYFFGFYRNNTQNGFFLSYNDKTGKIIVGYNANGKIDGIAKYFMPENEGRILGIIDDRGKYIYVTEKEMNMIENLFMKRGRINKGDLIKECNKIIKFEPTEENKIKIAQEQKEMLEKIESELNIKK